MPDAPKSKLFLLDSMALIYRAHYALIRSPRFTSGGRCTSAVFGLVNSILEILDKHKPTHLAAVYDTPEPTHRHEEFPEYKAQREAPPEDLTDQFALVERLFEAFRIPIIRAPGWEADDIIGTLSVRAHEEGLPTWMVTPDKDYDQLVKDNVVVLKPGRQGGRFEVLGVEEVLAKWSIERVEQVIDILALMGDASDNIKGVPGIGEKTAVKLIAKFGSVERLLESTDQLKGKQRENVETYAEDALIAKRLVTIRCDVPVDTDLEKLAVQKRDNKELRALFTELEFDTLGKRVFGQSFSAASARAETVRNKRALEIQSTLFDEPVVEKTLADVPHDYKLVDTAEGRSKLLACLLEADQVCFDTETTGLDPRTATPLGVSFAIEPGAAWYVACPDDEAGARAVLEEFRPVFESERVEKIGHNLKYDVSLLKWQGILVGGTLFDTMLAHAMKEPELRHGLDDLAKLYLGYKPIPTSALIGERGAEQRSMRDVPLDKLVEYACEDADVALQISRVIRKDIEARGVAEVCYDVECPLIPVIVDMEYEGIRLDSDALGVYSEQLGRDIADLRDDIWAAAGREFNIDSPKQLGVVLYEDLKLVDKPKKTATGQYSTREAELLRLAPKHEIVRNVLDYRNAAKLKSVYVDQLPSAVNEKTGRLHTHYSQAWTSTGRMQSNDPNLQTIPVRKERGREIRAAFRPRDDDHVLLAADYSQIELRIMADLSADEAMLDAFRTGTDIHRVTAAQVFHVDPADVTREMRDKAKAVNFGIIYGISAFGLQQRLNIPRAEANDLIKGYFAKYAGVQVYIDKTIAEAKEKGYVTTRTGRRRYLRDINSRNRTAAAAAERLAMNSPIQGTAADLLKLAMIKVHAALRAGNYRTKMLLTVHDELVFDLHKDERETVPPVIEECMTTALPMQVPIVVEMGTGESWLEAH